MTNTQVAGLMFLAAVLVAVCMWCYQGPEEFGYFNALARLTASPTVNRDFVNYSQAGDNSAGLPYASESDPYQSRTILNLGPYPAPVQSPTDTDIKNYIKANYLQQLIPAGGLYGPADADDLNYAYAAYTQAQKS